MTIILGAQVLRCYIGMPILLAIDWDVFPKNTPSLLLSNGVRTFLTVPVNHIIH